MENCCEAFFSLLIALRDGELVKRDHVDLVAGRRWIIGLTVPATMSHQKEHQDCRGCRLR
jgi:hypothetical protein